MRAASLESDTASLKSDSSRTAGRKRVLMAATVISAAGTFQVRIRDLSDSGANLHSDARLPVNSDVIFQRGDLFAAAKVAWSDRTHAGIAFYRKLSRADMAQARN
jgi:hypothetical protein